MLYMNLTGKTWNLHSLRFDVEMQPLLAAVVRLRSLHHHLSAEAGEPGGQAASDSTR